MPALPDRDLPEEPHLWTAESGGDPEAPFDRFGHALLRNIRDRGPPRNRLRMGIALALAIVFHVVLIVFLRLAMRPQYVAPQVGERESVIQVTFFERPSAPTASPAVPQINLPPPMPSVARPHVRVEPHRPHAMTATIGPPPPALRVYGDKGQVLLPPASSVAAPAYATPQPQEPALMKHSTPLPYHSTRFNNDWAPESESLGAKTFRRAVDATTAEKTIRLPGGLKIKCGISPLMIAAGCGMPPPPAPPKNDDDIRLSMPPPVSLTGKKVTLPAMSSTSALPAKASTAPKPAEISH